VVKLTIWIGMGWHVYLYISLIIGLVTMNNLYEVNV